MRQRMSYESLFVIIHCYAFTIRSVIDHMNLDDIVVDHAQLVIVSTFAWDIRSQDYEQSRQYQCALHVSPCKAS